MTLSTPPIITSRLSLSTPSMPLAGAMLDFAIRNREHVKPWSPPAPPGLYTPEHWQDVVAKSSAALAAGTGMRFWITPLAHPERIIGSIGFSQISRGPFCACVLGYQIDRDFEGQGLMSEAVRAALTHMFEQQKMHRVAANYRPENIRSGRLLAKLGFRIEGFARDYLFIDGEWRDHILTSVTNAGFDKSWISTG